MMNQEDWVYGIHAVDALLSQNPGDAIEMWVQQGRIDQRIQRLVKKARDEAISLRYVAKQVLDAHIKGVHQGIAVQCTRKMMQDPKVLEDLLADPNHEVFLMILEGITDPHNLGACLRSADAAGVDAVILPRSRTMKINATVRKAASGAVESLTLVEVGNLVRTLKWLKSKGVWVTGSSPDAEDDLYESNLTGPIALIMGAEDRGLRRLTAEACDRLVSIPMYGKVGSLNVSTATAICLYEILRQRNQSRMRFL